jgi:uncharacterized protein (DUF488 family)
VRAFPASRRHPQFSRERLAAALGAEDIRYDWQGKALGGFRKAGEHSAHVALKNPFFRAYAEHMESAAFADAMRGLAAAARSETICVMCAESDPAHCHRSLMADWLAARGERVVHLLAPGKQAEHALSPLAVLEEGRLVYRGAQKRLL